MIEERDDIPGATLRDDNPYEIIEESDETPGATCPPRDDSP